MKCNLKELTDKDLIRIWGSIWELEFFTDNEWIHYKKEPFNSLPEFIWDDRLMYDFRIKKA
tara:strand:- start:42 stop:224 length:183 start_codon:yes stop_codon:yes gene_type:complete